MTDLATLQAEFQAGILSAEEDALPDAIRPGSRETAGVLFGIYRYAYAARLVEVLQGNFDQTWTLLGDEGFAAAARAYIATAPSEVRNARWYGEGFSEFLRALYPGMPAVGDLAALDWAIASAFDAADSPVCGVDAMAALHPQEWPGLRFTLHPAVRRIAVTTPAATVYDALNAGEPPGPLDPVAAHTILVWREDYAVRYRALPADEDAALTQLADRETFSVLCEVLSEFMAAETAGARAAELLRLWLDCGIIASVDPND